MTSSGLEWTSFVGPVVGLAGVVIAYWLGRRGKKLDFRFDTLQKAAVLFYKVERAARDYARKVSGFDQGGTVSFADREESVDVFYSFILEASALTDVLDLLFGQTAKGHWDAIFENFAAAHRKEKEFSQASEAAAREYEAFLRIAAWDCGLLPWEKWRTKTRERFLKVSRFGAGDDFEKGARG